MLSFLLFFFLVFADPQFSVRGPEPEVVRLGGQAIITLALEGLSDDANLEELPEVDGLELAAGRPTQSSIQSIINGRVSRSMTITWRVSVLPQREGVFEIPSLTVNAGGKKFRSQALRIEVAKDIRGEKYAFLEISAPRNEYFVQEPIRFKLRFGFEDRFLKSNIIQLFNQRLDIPAQLRAPWIDDLQGTVVFSEPNAANNDGKRISFALNDRIAEAVQVKGEKREEKEFLVFEIEKSFLPTRSGDLMIPESLLRFAYATRFQNDVFGGRMAADKTDGFAYGKGLTLKILPLPEENRPAAFTGAVGRFSIHADANPRDLKVGESLKLTLRIEGEGNLGFFDPPRLDELKDFHVYGKIEEKSEKKRTITYDLTPLSEEVKELPSISFAYFDTNSPAGYKNLKTQPIPIHVKALPESEKLKALPGNEKKRVVAGESDIFDMKPIANVSQVGGVAHFSSWVLLSGILLPWFLALFLFLWIRSRERDQKDPAGVRARGAAANFRNRIHEKEVDLAEAFAEFLGARLHCAAAAVIAPDLADRLVNAGIPKELAERSAKQLEVLTHARYGGAQSSENSQEIISLVEELEQFFQQGERRR